MRFHDFYEDILGSREKIRFLTLFLNFPSKIFSANEAAGLIGISATGAWRFAKDFERQGILFRRRIGHADAWQLRENHFIVKKLQVLLADPWVDVSKAIQEKLRGVHVIKVVLYGSMARKEERPNSDVDVLVLVKSAEDKDKTNERLLDLALDFMDRFGNRLSPIIFTEKEYAEKMKTGLPLIGEIKKEGRVLFERR